MGFLIAVTQAAHLVAVPVMQVAVVLAVGISSRPEKQLELSLTAFFWA
ncbi:MAG: hypothetical protein H0T84_12815 [Tatlockia sp.]|nr:hypothetical protein [Tatlockia sp.]